MKQDGPMLDGLPGEDHVEDHEMSFEELTARVAETSPAYLPARLVDMIPRAQQSLRLLLAAAPDHPILQEKTQHIHVRWSWGFQIMTDVLKELGTTSSPAPIQKLQPDSIQANIEEAQVYEPELVSFHQFDLDPEHAKATCDPDSQRNDLLDLEAHMANFPDLLPLIVPTPAALAELVFDPVRQQATLLSETLVSLFLDERSELNFASHLMIMRSYLLLTSDSFKGRLSAALFSAASEPPDATSRTTMDSRRRKNVIVDGGSWSIGLASGLSSHADSGWPPRDSDFNFHLRTVIVDSLMFTCHELGDEASNDIWRHAESKLGFAIRDLPVVTGHEGWLDPHCESSYIQN